MLVKHKSTIVQASWQDKDTPSTMIDRVLTKQKVRVIKPTKHESVVTQLRKAIERQNAQDNDCTVVFFHEDPTF